MQRSDITHVVTNLQFYSEFANAREFSQPLLQFFSQVLLRAVLPLYTLDP